MSCRETESLVGSFRPIPNLQGEFLESPVWDCKRELLFLCDTTKRQVLAANLEQGLQHTWAFEEEVSSLGLCESGRVLVALPRQLVILDPETKLRTLFWADFREANTSKFNDGKVGPDGAYWVGSMDGRPIKEPISKLYRISADGSAQVKSDGFEVSNGLAWSADGSTMFHSDSRGSWIDRYAFDAKTGALSERRRIRNVDPQLGRPDGGATDVQGGYWSAGASAGFLHQFDNDGALIDSFRLPVNTPTMPCFCGPDLRFVAVTTHRFYANPERFAGCVFIARARVTGTPVGRMAGV